MQVINQANQQVVDFEHNTEGEVIGIKLTANGTLVRRMTSKLDELHRIVEAFDTYLTMKFDRDENSNVTNLTYTFVDPE